MIKTAQTGKKLELRLLSKKFLTDRTRAIVLNLLTNFAERKEMYPVSRPVYPSKQLLSSFVAVTVHFRLSFNFFVLLSYYKKGCDYNWHSVPFYSLLLTYQYHFIFDFQFAISIFTYLTLSSSALFSTNVM